MEELADQPAAQRRRPRADSARNRKRVLEAAKTVLGAGGPQASLEEVARQAGVGIGTLYRHFPTRHALFEAVYRREVEQLVELADQLLGCPDPVAALRRWLRANVDFVATKKGMAAALAIAASGTTALSTYTAERLTAAVGSLIGRAVAAGVMRDDVGPGDLLRMLVALCYGSDAAGWQENVLRLLEVFVDGLCKSPSSRSC
ncbi:MAG: TetR/AcrR family transcriptional regulator [Acetobacteraceae bacterium]|nr:MAG: TetR/AcrR family transcriptional regulator [Acetobacteraceae bacterium]